MDTQPRQAGAAWTIGGAGQTVAFPVPRGATRELIARQAAILAKAARGGELPDLLDDLCRLIGEREADTTCTVLLLDGQVLRHGAAPGMPEVFTEAIDGEHIGPDRGSCGTAAHLKRTVVVDDIATDPRWAQWRDLALGLGWRACWSVPVLDVDGSVLATFAAYATRPRRPSPDELELLEGAADFASILIGQDRARSEAAALADRLARANAELEEANRSKDEFLSMTSHELRTPLTPMGGMLETLELRWDDLSDARRRELVTVVARHTRRLEQLVDDLLTMASVSAGRLNVSPRPVAVRGAVQEAVESVFPEERTVQVDGVPDDLTAVVDRDHLQQILINYLTNALKYAPSGPIAVTAEAVVDQVHVRVLDRGPGVADDFVPSLFQPFEQHERGDRRTVRGTGLGLSVVRALADANGGRAWYEPREGGGSSFAVALPRAHRA